MTPVILDVELLICGVLRSEARYVAHADGFWKCFYIFSLKPTLHEIGFKQLSSILKYRRQS